MKARIAPDRRFTWLRQIDLETAEDSTRRAHHHDFVREQDGFLRLLLCGRLLLCRTCRELHGNPQSNGYLLLLLRHRKHHLTELLRCIAAVRTFANRGRNALDDAVKLYFGNAICGDMG